MLEDKLLIFKFTRGNRETLRSIYEKYKDNLVTLAAALLVDAASAEDTVHDVFVGFIESSHKFRLTGSLKSYLATCVANNARNRNKDGRIRQNRQAEMAMQDANRPDAAAMFGEELRRLCLALEQLPYEQREVLLLHTYSGMKFKAIAKEQNVSIDTVQGRYRYALDKLRSIKTIKIESQRRFGRKSSR